MAVCGGSYVYVIDDDRDLLDSLAFLLSALGYDSRTFNAPEDFLEQAAELAPGYILTDLRMPGMDGFELVAEARRAGFDWPVVMMTSDEGEDLAGRARAARFVALLSKPVDSDSLAEALKSALPTGRG